jgi:hypothetical protein
MKWLSKLKKDATTDTTDRLHKKKIREGLPQGIGEMKMESQPKPVSEILSKKKKKKAIRVLQKELDKLVAEHVKAELRPCSGDTDLREKENDLNMLEEKIRTVEKDLNKYIYPL